MKTAAQATLETKRVYRFEDTYLSSPFLNKDRAIGELRRVGRHIWKQEGTKLLLPTFIAGQGIYQNGRYLSFYSPSNHTIVFARNQREYGVLIHELVHAMGRKYWNHGAPFVKRYFELLVQYGRQDLNELVFAAAQFDIRVNMLS